MLKYGSALGGCVSQWEMGCEGSFSSVVSVDDAGAFTVCKAFPVEFRESLLSFTTLGMCSGYGSSSPRGGAPPDLRSGTCLPQALLRSASP